MKQIITKEELIYLCKGNSFATIAKIINQRFTEMTTPKQPEPLSEFEPFDVERARAGEAFYNLDGVIAKQYCGFANGEVVVLWSDSSCTISYPKSMYDRLRHKRKAKPIEFNSLLDRCAVWNKPSDFDKVELMSSNNGEDVMKATKGNIVAYYLGKFNDEALK